MPTSDESSPAFSEDIAHGLFKSENPPHLDQLWQEIQATEAPLVRSALVRAESLRILHMNPGDAYLRGIADALGYKHRQEFEQMVSTGIASIVTPIDREIA